MTPFCSRLALALLVIAVLSCAQEAPAHPPPAPLAQPSAPWVTLSLAPALPGFRAPVQVTHANDGSKRLFVVEQAGLVRVVTFSNEGVAAIDAAPFLDARALLGAAGGEQGLLGLAFHPRFAANGRLFFAYTDKGEANAVAEVRVGKDGRADLMTLRTFFAIADFASNHNGGMLAFGPDGKLWIGTGDGGGGGDPKRTAQDEQSFLGKMLVLDVDALPAASATPTIAFKGLRNPWRYSFDRSTGDLWIGDVGQNAWESLYFVDRSRLQQRLNFGWSVTEGAHCFRPGANACDAAGFERVVFDYPHGPDGCSITGGYSYRGKASPALVGSYVVGDYCSGRVWIIKRDAASKGFRVAKALDSGLQISSFGEDEAGELWLVDHSGGSIRRVLAGAAG